jgi:uncharacterized protein YndB with AHSA1/START domain
MQQTLTVERSIWIKAPRERVWRAVTDPQQLEQWYAKGCPWQIPVLQVGGTVRFYNTDTDIQLATIEVLDPPRQFTLRWLPDPAMPEAALLNTFLLVEENDGTRVTVIQSGYESLPAETRQQWLDADTSAYTTIVENLKSYLEDRNNHL